MPLTLVTGPANASKAGRVLGDYRSALPDDPILVVPTRADVAHYTRELAADGAVLGGSVTAFGGLIREVARRAGYGGRPVGRRQRDRLVGEAVRGADLTALASSAGSPGFVTAAGELFAELERAFVEPGRFARALGAWASRAPGRDDYAREVSRLYGRYVAALERLGRVDEDGFAWRALDALRAAPGAWGNTPVFLYGFDDLTRAQRDAVETIARTAPVTLSLTFERGRVAFAGRAATFAELQPLAGEAWTALEPAAGFYAPGARAALHHLERGLFEEGGSPRRADGAVRLLEAGGERAEIELVAAEVLGLLRDGFAPGEIAVVMRSPGGQAPLVQRVFDAYGVPVALEWTVPLVHGSFGRALLGLARSALLSDDAPAADLLAYLRAPGLLERSELADRLEVSVRQGRLRTAAEARSVWEEQNPNFALDELDRLRDAATRGERELIGALRRAAAALFVRPRRGGAPVLSEGEVPEARAYAEVCAALDELDELAATGAVARAGAEALLDTLAALEVRHGDAARGGAVLVSDPLGVRARRFRAVFLCGLQEGEFPRLVRPEPFLGEDVRAELYDIDRLALRAPADALAEERYLFYSAISRAEERVVLSFRVSDEEGNPTLPSFFVSEVRRLFGPELEDTLVRRPLAEVTWPLARAPVPSEVARAQAAEGPREPPRSIAPLSFAAAKAVLRHQKEVSAGTLEAYADCPVKWLVDKELQPEALEPKPDYFARGSYAHAVLERTLTRMREEQGSARLSEANLPVARGLLAEVVESERSKFTLARSTATADAVSRRVHADLERYLTHAAHAPSGATEPTHFELPFGMGEEAKPPLELAGGEVKVRGFVDRIDVDSEAGAAIVHDYKSGSSAPRYYGSNWEGERQLQVALYMLFVQRVMGHEPRAGVYQPLRGGELRGRGIARAGAPGADEAYLPRDLRSREEISALLAEAEERAVGLARRLRAGELTPQPATCTRDGGCAFPGICRGPGA